MKQQNLSDVRDYRLNPRSYSEHPDPNHRNDIFTTEEQRKESPVKQSEAEGCDINLIMKRFEATGLLPEQRSQPIYGDFTTMETYQEAMGIVAMAKEQFAGLPATVRDEFANDPSRFLNFMETAMDDAEGQKKLVKYGLATETEVSESNEAILKQIRDNTKQQPASTASKP